MSTFHTKTKSFFTTGRAAQKNVNVTVALKKNQEQDKNFDKTKQSTLPINKISLDYVKLLDAPPITQSKIITVFLV